MQDESANLFVAIGVLIALLQGATKNDGLHGIIGVITCAANAANVTMPDFKRHTGLTANCSAMQTNHSIERIQ